MSTTLDLSGHACGTTLTDARSEHQALASGDGDTCRLHDLSIALARSIYEDTKGKSTDCCQQASSETHLYESRDWALPNRYKVI